MINDQCIMNVFEILREVVFEFDNELFLFFETHTSLPLSANARATAIPMTPAPTTRQSTRSTGRAMREAVASDMQGGCKKVTFFALM